MNKGWFKKGNTPWNKGRTHTVEVRKKISESRIGIKPCHANTDTYRSRRPIL